MMRIMTIVGTRPEVIRLSRVIAKLDSVFDHLLVHTGQNFDYSLNGIFFDQLGLRAPDEYLDAPIGDVGSAVGGIIERSFKIFTKYKPDALLVLGDTNSCLSVYPAKRLKIPVFHMEAGNRCFDQNVPEEINRRVVDCLADINLPYSDIAREYLLRENFPPDRIVTTGSPMAEVLNFYQQRIHSSTIIQDLSLSSNGYFVVSVHREENVNSKEKIAELFDLLRFLASKFGRPIIVSVHPRTRQQIDRFPEAWADLSSLVVLSKPFGFFDYCKLQASAICTLSDSGTIHEEASILGFNAINLRSSNERPEAMEKAIVPMISIKNLEILQTFIEQLCTKNRKQRLVKAVSDYGDLNVSDKVIETLISYIPYVKRVVWGQVD